jgi:hypothetical protein
VLVFGLLSPNLIFLVVISLYLPPFYFLFFYYIYIYIYILKKSIDESHAPTQQQIKYLRVIKKKKKPSSPKESKD